MKLYAKNRRFERVITNDLLERQRQTRGITRAPNSHFTTLFVENNS